MKNFFRFCELYNVEFDADNQKLLFMLLANAKSIDKIEYRVEYSFKRSVIYVELFPIENVDMSYEFEGFVNYDGFDKICINENLDEYDGLTDYIANRRNEWDKVDLKEEEEIDLEEYEEAFANLMGDLDEMLDAMYINGVR